MNDVDIENFLMEHIDEKLDVLETQLLEFPQVDIPVESLFINGMYARKILIAKDTILTGRVHLEDYVDIMISGDITVATPTGTKRFKGFNVFEGKKGRKRAGYAHEDTHWITVHKTEIKDPDEFVSSMTVFNMSNYKSLLNDKSDYVNLVAELGLTEKDVQDQVNNTEDFTKTTEYSHLFEIKPSLTGGVGFFAKKPFEDGEIIMPSRLGEVRTEAGRYVNHSLKPNAQMSAHGDNIYLIASKEIKEGEEVVTNYRKTIETLRSALCQQ